MRRDVLSAYAASAAKVLSWVIVSALVFREHPFQFAVLALARGTLSLLNYTTLGLSPVLVQLLAQSRARPRRAIPVTAEIGANRVLPYAPPETSSLGAEAQSIYANGLGVAFSAGLLGLMASTVYALFFERLHETPLQGWGDASFVWWFGAGLVLRLVSEAPGVVVQVGGSISRDNAFVIFAEAAWVMLVFILSRKNSAGGALNVAAMTFAVSGALLLTVRLAEAAKHVRLSSAHLPLLRKSSLFQILSAGALISVAQLADFLYAPTDYILINHLISPGTVAYYAAAVQIDAGLLLLVGALAAVMLPKAALAHAGGDLTALRRYYVRGTLLSAALLVIGAVLAYLLSEQIFEVWLGNSMPRTQAILPLVLVHTVVGGSAGVGRAILLGMGKVKPFAIAALVAGAANVVLSYSFVKFFGLGLNGIVYGTIVAVVCRCVLWQPWYVMRTLRREAGRMPSDEAETTTAAAIVPPPEPL